MICNEVINFWRYLHTDHTSSLVQTAFSNLGSIKNYSNSKNEHRTQVRWLQNQQKFQNEKIAIISEIQHILLSFIYYLQSYYIKHTFYVYFRNPNNLHIGQKFIYRLQAIYPQFLSAIVQNCKFDVSTLQSYLLNHLIHDHNLVAQEKPIELFPKDSVYYYAIIYFYSRRF